MRRVSVRQRSSPSASSWASPVDDPDLPTVCAVFPASTKSAFHRWIACSETYLSSTRSLRDRHLPGEHRQHDPGLRLRRNHGADVPSASLIYRPKCPHNRPAKKLEAGHLESTPSARNIKQSLDRHSATMVMTQETSEAGLRRSALLRPDLGDVDVTMWTVLSGLKRRAKR